MFGALQVARGHEELPKLRSRSANVLLAFLALHPGKEFSRHDLGAMIWPDSDGDRQQQNVRRCLSDIRQALEGDDASGNVLIRVRDHAGLHATGIHTDVSNFRELVRRGGPNDAALKEAVEIYSGPLLPAMSEYCFVPIRMELEEQYSRAVVTLCEHLCETSPSEATSLGRRAVLCAPLREDIHVALIRAYIKSGMSAEAVRQFEELERIIDDEFGEAPSDSAISALESIPRNIRRPETPPEFDQDIVLLTSSADNPFAKELAIAMNKERVGVALMKDEREMGSWARSLEDNILRSAAVVAVIGPQDSGSETLFEQCELGIRLAELSDNFRLTAIVLESANLANSPLEKLLRQFVVLNPDSPQAAAVLIKESLRRPISNREKESTLELSGGSVPLNSPYYIERYTDVELRKCFPRGEGVILVKGPRQVGKTSLTARAMTWARSHGYKTALCDFQTVNISQLSNDQGLYRVIGHRFAKDLGVPFDWQGKWSDWLGPNDNLEEAVEHVLSQMEGPVLWVMDEVDRLFGQPVANDFFGLLRGWYNRRTLEPDGPWHRLTFLITYATEAHLFITDLNQSPFNIGVRLELADFSTEQMAELNECYGLPLVAEEDVLHLHELTGGHPYLARRAYDWLVTTHGSVGELEEVAAEDDGPFGDHLRRLLLMVRQDKDTFAAVGRIVRGQEPSNERTLYELASGGLLKTQLSGKPIFRSPVYRRWLEARMPGLSDF